MSTLQPRIHSPQSRQPYSPKLASPNPLSPPNSGHHSKKSQKHNHKSPKSSKDKRSPNKNSSLKSNYDTKVTDANSPSRSKGQSTTTTGRKNQPKSKHNSENALTYDNRLDNKVRQLDHHILYPQHDGKVPYKQKSHSVKSVSVPHELLVSPKSYDPNLAAALLNKKPQTAKHANFNDAELQADYNTDLMTMYNNRQEEYQSEVRTNKGNKFFSSSKQKKDSEISKRKVNTPETSPPSRAYQNEENKKFKNKVSPRAYEIIVGSPARGHNSQSNQQQKTYKTKYGNFMQGPLPGIEEQFEENVKVYSVKSAEFRNRTGSMPNDTYEAFYETDGNSRSPARPKTTKNSEPNVYSDPNIYNKRASESQVQAHQVMQSGKDKYVSSTRSAFEPICDQRNEKDQFMSDDILKHNALRELKVNPNAKFLLLREQVRERRNRAGFKSADWNATEEITKHASQHQTSPTKNYNMSPPISPILCQSPNVLKSIDVSTSPIRDSRSVEKENVTHNDQLVQLFNKTKNILASYKHKEQDWDKERKMFISEIKRLRGLLKETVN